MKIHPRVTQINSLFGEGSRVSLYFIRGERNAIIDTGTAHAPQDDIAPALKDLGLKLADIALILNTHGHFDHTGGNATIKNASNAQVFIHNDDVMLVENHERYFEQKFLPTVEAILGKEHIEEERARFLEMAGPDVVVDRRLKDNDIIELGDECDLRVIHLPGHSSGSVGFYCEKEGILFAGDSLPGLGEDGRGLPIIHNLPAYERSLERLQKLPLKLILHAHEFRGLRLPPSTMRRGKEIRQYLRDCQEVAKQIIEAVQRIAPYASGKSFIEVTDEVIAQLPKEMGFKPAGQAVQPFFSAITIFSYLSRLNR